MPETVERTKVRINGVNYVVDKKTELTYEEIMQVVRIPFDLPIFYISTKGPIQDRKAGVLNPTEKLILEDGLDISCHIIVDSEENK